MPKREAGEYTARVTADPTILVGKPIIVGTRIAVEHILEQLADNPDLGEFFEVYPDLTVEDVRAALEYGRALVAGEAVFPTPRSSTSPCASNE